MVFSGERVRQARELKELTQSALAKLIGVSQAAIAQIEAGAYIGSQELLQDIARKTGLPIQFFQQGPAREFPAGSLLFRAHASMTKRDLVSVSRSAQLVHELYTKLQLRLRTIHVRLPALGDCSPDQAATKTRAALGLTTTDPIPHLLNLLEWHGVIALVVPDVKSRDAFSLWLDDSPVIALSEGRSGDRSRLTVAHELGHLVMHRGKSRFEVDDHQADEFAAELLMPANVVAKEIQAPVTLSSLVPLKTKWRVSLQALIRRAYDLELIVNRQYRYLFEQLSAMGWRKAEPIEIVPEKPRALRQMVEMLYGDPIDYQSFQNDMAVDAKRLREIVLRYAGKSAGPVQGQNLIRMPKKV